MRLRGRKRRVRITLMDRLNQMPMLQAQLLLTLIADQHRRPATADMLAQHRKKPAHHRHQGNVMARLSHRQMQPRIPIGRLARIARLLCRLHALDGVINTLDVLGRRPPSGQISA
jgi:hypothetical protein